MKILHHLIFWTALLSASLATAQTPPPAPAEDPDPLPKPAFKASAEQVDPFYGSFSTNIPIEVPPFHGLEPAIGLAYSSSGGNGIAGVGWSVSGFSTIERVSSGRGAAFALIGPGSNDYGPDVYLLDGQELIPCAPGSTSPSCTSGGTHTTKTENYQRITRAIQTAIPRAPRFQPWLPDGELEVTWTITRKDGTEVLYVPMFVFPSAGARDGLKWGIARVRDTRGNEVLYGWRCDGVECYPDQVLYGTISVTLNYETRPDPIHYALGTLDHAVTNDRLKSIDVAADMYLVRAYAITYTTSPETSRSILTSIRQYGNDASIGADGTISGGTALPPIDVHYDPASSALHHRFDNANEWGTRPIFAAWAAHWTGDFDGDGRSDLLYVPYGYTGYVVELSTGVDCPPPSGTGPCGFAAPSVWADFEFVSDWRSIFVQDLDADGKDDLLYVPYTQVEYVARLSTGVTCPDPAGGACGFAPGVGWSSFTPIADWSSVWLREVDGDGLPDLIHVGPMRDQYRVQLNTGSGFGPVSNWADYEYPLPYYCVARELGTVSELEPNGFGSSSHAIGLDGHMGRVEIHGELRGSVYSDTGGGDLDLYSINVPPDTTMTLTAQIYGSPGQFETCNGDTLLHVIDYQACVNFNGCVGVDGLNAAIVAANDNGATTCSSLVNHRLNPGVYLIAVSRVPASGPLDFEYAMNVELNADCPSSSKQVWFADFNGDGKTDVMTLPNPLTDYAVRLSTGSSFGTLFSWAPYQSVPHLLAIRTGDFNGDGKSDVMYLASAFDGYYVMLSSGNGFLPPQRWATYEHVDHLGFSIWTTDLNSDGRTDLMFASGGAYRVLLSTGTSFAAPETWAPYPGLPHLGAIWVQDFTDDGVADILDHPSTSVAHTMHRGLGSPIADLVHSVGNGLGGSIALDYVPSNTWTRTNAVPRVQTVSAVEISDGRGQVARSTFTYDGALYDHVDRRFLGFRHSRQTRPCIAGESACPYDDTWFRQDFGAVSKPERSERRAGNGELLAVTSYEYATNGAALPHTCLETGRWTEEHAGGELRRSRVEKSYDGYGNLIEERTLGDFDVAGDEHTMTKEYRPNIAAYLVGLASASRTFDAQGALVEETLFAYDGATDFDTEPVLGNLTTESRWSSATNSYVTRHNEFDAHGNVIVRIDPEGSRTTSVYDPELNQFEVSTTNMLGHTILRSWNIGCAKESSTRNPNGQTTTRYYDALCRPSRTDLPGGNYVSTTYLDLGSPNLQRMRRETPGNVLGAVMYKETRFDGLGREYRTDKSGPNPIITEKSYDERGSVATETAPRYAGEPAQTTVYRHDALDRRTRSTFPDGTFVTESYGLGSTTKIDELGHVEVIDSDVFGLMTRKREQIGTEMVTTAYTYDARKNLIGIRDHAGNVWSYTYDSLDQKIAEVDPDRGARTFEYDGNGKTTVIVDAKGQRTEITYDAIGRERTRTILAGTPAATVRTSTYDRVRAGFYNIGKLTDVSDASSAQSFDYDVAERAVEETQVAGGIPFTFRSGYDAGGRLITQTYPDGDTVGTFGDPIRYDAAGRVVAIPGVLWGAGYLASGEVSSVTLANGTVTTRTYSPARDRLERIVTVHGDTTIQDLSFARDAEGKITGVTSPFANESWTYRYDELHRMTGASSLTSGWDSQTFVYDLIGNFVESSRVGCYVYPSPGSARPHGAIQAGANSYAYDANGNMIAGGGRTIEYDGEDRVVRVDGETFTYDAGGERITRTAGGETTYYPGAGYEVAGNGVVTKYIALGRHQIAKRVGGETFWLHTDHLDSVQSVTDERGRQVQRESYRPYGETIGALTSHEETKTWLSEQRDATGLIYLHARYYDPVLSAFISADPSWPLDQGVGLNRYAYADGDPINKSDTRGKSWDSFGASLPSIPDGVFNFTVGLADGMSFGIGKVVREKLTDLSNPDYGSGAYLGGTLTGVLAPGGAYSLAIRAAKAKKAWEAARLAKAANDTTKIVETMNASKWLPAAEQRAVNWDQVRQWRDGIKSGEVVMKTEAELTQMGSNIIATKPGADGVVAVVAGQHRVAGHFLATGKPPPASSITWIEREGVRTMPWK